MQLTRSNSCFFPISSFNNARGNVLVWRELNCGRYRPVCAHHPPSAPWPAAFICALFLLSSSPPSLHSACCQAICGLPHTRSVASSLYADFRGHKSVWNICSPWFRSWVGFSGCILLDQEIENFITPFKVKKNAEPLLHFIFNMTMDDIHEGWVTSGFNLNSGFLGWIILYFLQQ